MGSFIDITGQKFGRLTAIRRQPKEGDSRAYWSCECECGKTAVVSGKALRSGTTKSCGCLGIEWAAKMGGQRDFIEKRAEAITRHGHKRRGRRSKEYNTWLRMKQRCYDTKCKDYPTWGGRGIRVCPSWENSFDMFLLDMGPAPSPLHQIDRLESNGDYSPNNCRWATPIEQGSDHRRNIYPVSVDGIKFPSLSAACRHYGVSPTAANFRIRSGWPIDLAVKAPSRSTKPQRSRESYLPKTHPDRT